MSYVDLSSLDDDNLIYLHMHRKKKLTSLLHQHKLLTPKTPRSPSMFEQRLCWEKFTRSDREKKERFWTHLRMSKKSFSKLLHLIRDDIKVNQEMAMRRGGAIIPELCLYCTI
jgi:hypothetical protein